MNEGKVCAFNVLAMRVPYMKQNFAYYKLLGKTFFRTGDLEICDKVFTIGDKDNLEYLSVYTRDN